MQSEKVQIHEMHKNIMTLTKTILDCYIKHDHLRKNNIEFNNPRYFVRTRCLDFLIEAVKQIKQRYKFKSNPAQLFECLDPSKIKNNEFYTVSDLVEKFKYLVQDTSIQTIDSEWRQLRNYDFSNCPVNDLVSFWVQNFKTEMSICFPI
jgi:hypothetical protein